MLGGALVIHSVDQLEYVYMPKLTEISNGHVFIWAAASLCHLLTIDFYGELFQDPCHPLEQHDTEDNKCQYLSVYHSCCDDTKAQFSELTGKFDCNSQLQQVREVGLSKEVIQGVSKFMIQKFWPESSGAYCKGDKFISKVHPGMITHDERTIAAIYGMTEETSIHRCWLGSEDRAGQIQTRSNCDPLEISGGFDRQTHVWKFSGRCSEIKGKQVNCNSLCSGGCIHYINPEYVLKMDANQSKTFHKNWKKLSEKPWLYQSVFSEDNLMKGSQLENTCKICSEETTQLPGGAKCSSNDHCQRSFVSVDRYKEDATVCYDHNPSKLEELDMEVYPNSENIVCPPYLPHFDETEDTCLKYCSKATFEFDQLIDSSDKARQTAECENLDSCETPNKGNDEAPMNGFECSDEQVCYGPGNPNWCEYIEDFKEFRGDTNPSPFDESTNKGGCNQMFNKFFIKSLENCTILDGNFYIKFGDFEKNQDTVPNDDLKTISSNADICRYVRKLKVITGYIQIHGWHGKSFDCFESLQEVWGKETILSGQNRFAIEIRTTTNGVLNLEHMGFPRLKRILYGSINVQAFHEKIQVGENKSYTINRLGPNFCQLEQNDQRNKIFVTHTDPDFTKSPLRLNNQIEILNGQFLWQPNRTYLEGAANSDELLTDDTCYKCHESCDQDYGCSGPSEFDCVKCKYLIDKSTKIDQNCTENCSRKSAFLTFRDDDHYIYKHDDGTFKYDGSPNELNDRASCTRNDTCEARSYKDNFSCHPCHIECKHGCNGPSASDCCAKDGQHCLSNFNGSNIEEIHNDTCEYDLLHDTDRNKTECVQNCHKISIKKPIDPRYFTYKLYKEHPIEKTLTTYPYFNQANSRVCGICNPRCIGGCELVTSKDETKCYNDVRGCFNATNDETPNYHIYIGEDCSDGWELLDEASVKESKMERVPICQEKCENTYSCEINLDDIDNPNCKAVSNKAMVGGVIGGLLILLSIIVFIIWRWRKEKYERPDKLAEEIIKLTYPTKAIEQKTCEPERYNPHFADIRFIDPKDLVIERELGDGHFGRVCFAKFRMRYNLSSVADGSTTLGSMRSESVNYSVAVKELKLDEQVEQLKIQDIIKIYKRYIKGVDHGRLEPNEGYDVRHSMNSLSRDDPEKIRYKRYFFHAKEAELIDETKKVAALQHPHLIRLIGIVKCTETKKLKDGGIRFTPAKMVVDFVPGGELKKWIRKNRHCIDIKYLSRWMYQIAMAMAYLEKKKIVHRDLAIRNILIRDAKIDPEKTHVLVSDFGLAKIVDSEEDFNRHKDEQTPLAW